GEPQVPATALDLIREIARAHAVGAAHDLVGPHDAWPQVRLGEVGARIGGGVGIEWDVAAFGGDHDLVASELGALDALDQHGSDDALAALVAIVHGGVQDVETALERLTDGAAVQRVGGGIFTAQGSSQTEARHTTGGNESAVVLGGNGGGKSPRVARRTFGSRASVDHGQATR